eukprot:2570906-Rhodomonas_salina.1
MSERVSSSLQRTLHLHTCTLGQRSEADVDGGRRSNGPDPAEGGGPLLQAGVGRAFVGGRDAREQRRQLGAEKQQRQLRDRLQRRPALLAPGPGERHDPKRVDPGARDCCRVSRGHASVFARAALACSAVFLAVAWRVVLWTGAYLVRLGCART